MSRIRVSADPAGPSAPPALSRALSSSRLVSLHKLACYWLGFAACWVWLLARFWCLLGFAACSVLLLARFCCWLACCCLLACLSHHPAGKLVSLSEQQIVDCAWGSWLNG